ncbi:MAG TPA: flavin reductase family protein [Candidatus Acidoferrales bacterium]|nr:flavin reductase family protein [Candidatus Acidoferrales bacterium]
MVIGKPAAWDEKELRRVLGQFATGVTVVTARGKDGAPVGTTVNSFTSVSLKPPLVLWCLAHSSQNLAAFRKTTHFAVNILSAGQHELSRRFALPAPDKFEGVDYEDGRAGVPLLKGVTAQIVCRKVRRLPGGDHDIFLGKVEEFQRYDGKPLVFHSGRYHIVTHHPEIPQ